MIGSERDDSALTIELAVPPSTDPQTHQASFIGVIGGLLITLGFFLPWYYLNYGQVSNGAPQIVSISGWTILQYHLTGQLYGETTSSQVHTVSYIFALSTLLPILLALVTMSISIAGQWHTPSALLRSCRIATLLGGSFLAFTLPTDESTGIFLASQTAPIQPLSGLGVVLMRIGFIALMTSVIFHELIIHSSVRQDQKGKAEKADAKDTFPS